MKSGMLTRSKLFHAMSPRNAWGSEVPCSMESRMRHRTKNRENIERLWTDHVGSSPTPFSQGHPLPPLAPVSADGGWFFGKIEVMSLWGWNRAASKVTCTPKTVEPQTLSIYLLQDTKVRSTQEKRILLWGNWKTPGKGLLKMIFGSLPLKNRLLVH